MYNLIDRDELIKRARPIENFPNGTIVVVLGVVKSLPTVDAEPVRYGHWVAKDMGDYEECICSVCGEENFGENYIIGSTAKYFPHCGVKMDGE